jgi:glutamate/aspartate transport system substrate-binding protein
MVNRTLWGAIAVSLIGSFINPAENYAQAAELTGTLKKIKTSGVLVMGVRDSNIPFAYADKQKKQVGYAVDLCTKVADNVKQQLNLPNLEIKVIPVSSQARIPLVSSGTIDMECGSSTNTLERQKKVGFSVTYFVATVRMAVKTNSGIKNLEDLNGKTIVTTLGTTSDKYIQRDRQGKKIVFKSIFAKDDTASFQTLESGKAAAFIMDDVLLAGLIAKSKNPKDYAIVGPVLSVEPYGIILRKNDPEFKKLVDRTLISLMQSGSIEKIYSKWFTQPLPPDRINLNLPISPSLEAAFQKPTDKGI